MPKTVVFPKVEPYYIFERDCIAFPALVDGAPVRCLVSLEALIQRFGAKGRSQQDAVDAFRKHREEIEKIGRQMIQDGNADDRNEVLIRSLSKPPAASFVFLSIPDRVRNDARLDSLVAEASAILAESLGEFSHSLTATWEYSDETGALLQLTLSDEETDATARDWYTPDQLKKADSLRSAFDLLRGDLLRAKTRKHLQKLESGPRDS